MNERILVIQQPNYVPWVGYFDLMARAEVWVWYDCVQYTKRDWRNRNLVAGPGEPFWLTIPVKTKGRYEQPVCEVEIDETRSWAKDHLASVIGCYRRAPYFELVFPIYESHLKADRPRLADLTIGLNEDLAGLLGIAPRFLRSSTMLGVSGVKQDRLLDIAGRFDCQVYLSGPKAEAYTDSGTFRLAGYELRFINYGAYEYPRGGRPFPSKLSVLDALFWAGPEATGELLSVSRKLQPVLHAEGGQFFNL